MKLHSSMRRFPVILPAIFLCISLIWLSCKKTSEAVNPITATETSTISILKSWLVEQKNNGNSMVQKSLDTVLARASWKESVETVVANGKTVIYVPLKNSAAGLEFFFDRTGNTVDSGNIVQVVNKGVSNPNGQLEAIKTYYEAVILQRPVSTPFSGSIAAYAITTRFIYAYNFKEGEIISRQIVAPKPKTQTVKTDGVSVRKDEICDEYAVWEFWSNGTVTLVGTFWVCTGGPDCTPPSLAISLGTGHAYIKVDLDCEGGNGGWGGGGGGGGGEEPDPPLLKGITNNLTRPCFVSTWSALMATGLSSNINYLLKQTFGLTSDYNIIIDEAQETRDGNGELCDGTTTPSINSSGKIDVHVQLSLSGLANASQEYIAIVICHEILHGYFMATGTENKIRDGNHEAMATAYQELLRTSVKALFPNSAADIDKLSWAGLKRTDAYRYGQLSQIEKENIEQMISDHVYSGAGTQCNP
jgi:hypothetical protein